MPIMNSAEERRQNELKEERKQTLAKFFDDFKTSFIIWIRIGGITVFLQKLLIRGICFMSQTLNFSQYFLRYSYSLLWLLLPAGLLHFSCIIQSIRETQSIKPERTVKGAK